MMHHVPADTRWRPCREGPTRKLKKPHDLDRLISHVDIHRSRICHIISFPSDLYCLHSASPFYGHVVTDLELENKTYGLDLTGLHKTA